MYFGQKTKRGVRSSGDNMTGAGEGDDEKLFVELGSVPAEVKRLAADGLLMLHIGFILAADCMDLPIPSL